MMWVHFNAAGISLEECQGLFQFWVVSWFSHQGFEGADPHLAYILADLRGLVYLIWAFKS